MNALAPKAPALLRKTLTVAACLVVSNLCLAGVAIVTARTMGPPGRGVLVLLTTVASFTVLVASCGTNYAARLHLPSKSRSVSMASFVTLAGPLLLVELALCGVIAPLVMAFADISLSSRGYAAGSLYGMMLLASIFSQDALYAVGKSVTAGILGGIGSAAQLVSVLCVLSFAGPTVGTIVGTLAFGLFLQTAGAAWILRSNAHLAPGKAKMTEWTMLLRSGAPALAMNLGQAGVLRIDRIALGTLRDSASVGIYSVAATATETLWLLPIALAQVIFHPLASSSTQSDGPTSARRKVMRLTLVLAGFLFVVAPLAVDVAFGREFESAVLPLRILIPGAVALGSYYVDLHTLTARGDLRTAARIATLGLVTMVTLDLLLIPTAGVVGAAWASTINYLILAGLVRRRVRAFTKPKASPTSDADGNS